MLLQILTQTFSNAQFDFAITVNSILLAATFLMDGDK